MTNSFGEKTEGDFDEPKDKIIIPTEQDKEDLKKQVEAMNQQMAAKDVETETLRKQLAEYKTKLEAKENEQLASAKPIA